MSDIVDLDNARKAKALKPITPLSVEMTSVDMMDIQIPSEEQEFDVETVQEKFERESKELRAMLELDPETQKEFLDDTNRLFKKLEAEKTSTPSLSKPIDMDRITKRLKSARQQESGTSTPPISS